VEALRAEAPGNVGSTIASLSTVPDLEKYGFFQRTASAIMMLDLREGPDAVYKRFSKGRRSDIQFAIRAGVEVIEASSENDFERYYQIYRDWCTRKNIGQHPRDVMFRALQLRSNRRLFLATHEGRVIAGTIIRFLENGVAEYAANNSPEEYQSLRPNPLLNWVSIQWAFEQGLKSFSMGGSHPYLRHFGGQEIPIYRYSADASFFKTFQLREWLIKKRQAYKKSRQASHD
jgi:lipid II:glycine glycyltransferase (peptidoglycan interpeptide bridge formation enzyme)